MATNAYWLSKSERVTVVRVDAVPSSRYRELMFTCFRKVGESVRIERKEIVLDDEARLIDELAEILITHRNPTKSTRYSLLLRTLLSQRVPYVERLRRVLKEKRSSSRQIQFDFTLTP